MRDYRNLAAVVMALTLMQIAVGALTVAVPLTLEAAGHGAAVIGAVAAFYGLGFMAGAWGAPRLIGQVGHIRAYAAFAAFGAVFSLLLYWRVDPIVWAVVRFGIGASVAALFAAGESWIADAAPSHRRGGLLSAYMVLARIGVILGPFLIAGAPPGGAGAFMVAGGFFALCLAPLALTRSAQPAAPTVAPLNMVEIMKIAPAALIGSLAAGAVNSAVVNLAPIYAAPLMPENPTAAAASFAAALMGGALVVQWPAGAVSDRTDRRVVVAALAGVAAVAGLILAFTPTAAPDAVIYALAAIWGAGALSFYGVIVAHAADRAPAGQQTPMMAGVLLAWAAGATVGPVVAGLFMQIGLGPSGLFVYAAAAYAVLVALMLHRRGARPSTEAEIGAKTPFAPVAATSTAAAVFDPRSDADVDPDAVELPFDQEPPAPAKDETPQENDGV